MKEELFPCVSSNPSLEETSNLFKYKVKQMLPGVSDDPNLPPMIEAVRAHIAISSGTLCKLVELIGSTETDFHIPIHVKEETVSDENENDEETVLKTVYIDKPLRPRNLTPRTVNQKFFRTAVLKMGTTSSDDEDSGLCLGRLSFTDPDDVESDDDSRPVESQTEANLSLDSTGIFYSEWTLGSHTLIVRFKVDAYLPVQQSTSDENPQRPHYFIGVKPKIEIDVPSDDPHLHLETYTPSELSSLWMYSQLRGDGLVVIPHVNPQTGAISTVDVLDPKKLRNLESATLESSTAAPSTFSWSTVCKSQAVLLDSLFTKLKQLEPGQYILHHGRDDTHAVIYRHVPIDPENAESEQTSRLFDLHNLYKSSLPSDPQREFTTDYRVKQWRPLDSNDLQIPYTFPIAPTHSVPGILGDNSGGVKHCYSYAQKGYCKVQNCRYPHLTATEITIKQQQEWKSRSLSISSTSSSQSTMPKKSKRKGKRNPRAKSKPGPPAGIDLDNVGADVDTEYIQSIVAGYD
ncbi:hypothetical protein BKA69DRAFT_831260 [Paraphysoderma sedebokerense]|nr:hypothetical protein BKA69DRAFT_831260 [Paraphysoderma sedebokerense]